MAQVVDKKVDLSLVGKNGNAFNLMAEFRLQAQREDWSKEEIDEVLDEAQSDDYNHLVATLDAHCEKRQEE